QQQQQQQQFQLPPASPTRRAEKEDRKRGGQGREGIRIVGGSGWVFRKLNRESGGRAKSSCIRSVCTTKKEDGAQPHRHAFGVRPLGKDRWPVVWVLPSWKPQEEE
uniref:Uncharacterized protein n=1 Tax=Clytia hemisphaerica TaxID=252671 RepID=A0A7M5XEM5_9CNID